MSENKIYHYYLTRNEYDAATKSDYAIYFVVETDGRITIYRGTQRTGSAIGFVQSFPQVGEQGIFFFQPSTGIMKIWTTQWVQIFPQEVSGTVGWDDITDKPTFSTVAESGSYNDLSNKPSIPDAQIQSDWNQSDNTKKDYIKNKPTIPAAQAQSDWNQSNTSALDYIKNKPALKTVATTGSYNDLSNKPTIPTATDAATNAQIDSRSASQDIRPSNVEYAVRSVLPNVTTIPAATTAYTLLDASATTNSHSAHYTHAPTGIPTYTLPAVTNTAIAHEILLDVDFTTVQACGFVDSQSAEIPLQSDISIAADDKWRFICVYSLDGWRVYPLPVEVAGGGGGTATLIVQGTTATSAGLAGTYEITNDTVNDHPIWYNSTNSKYLWLCENGMDAGYYGWVIGSTVAQQSAGDIPMFYEYFVADRLTPSDTPVGETWRTQMDELTAAQFTCVEG